jgi:hypothetical protein
LELLPPPEGEFGVVLDLDIPEPKKVKVALVATRPIIYVDPNFVRPYVVCIGWKEGGGRGKEARRKEGRKKEKGQKGGRRQRQDEKRGQEGRRAGGQEGRRAGGQEGRRAAGQEGRRAGGQEGRRAGGQ